MMKLKGVPKEKEKGGGVVGEIMGKPKKKLRKGI